MANIDVTYSYPEELMPHVIAALCDAGGYRGEIDGSQAAFAKQQVINYVRRTTEQYIRKTKIEEGVQEALSEINSVITPNLDSITVT